MYVRLTSSEWLSRKQTRVGACAKTACAAFGNAIPVSIMRGWIVMALTLGLVACASCSDSATGEGVDGSVTEASADDSRGDVGTDVLVDAPPYADR
jgi:hypothetical protein